MTDASRRRFIETLGLGVAALARRTVFSVGDEPPPATADVGVPPEGRSLVRSIRDLGVQFRDNRVNVTGQDAATSIALPGDGALWLFGDTIEGPFQSIYDHDLTHVLSNTGMLVPPQDVSEGIKQFSYITSAGGKRPRQLIPFTSREDSSKHRLWAIHGTTFSESIYLYYHKITMLPGKSVFVDFELNGMGLARAKIGEYLFERLAAPDGTLEFWKSDAPGFGVFIQKLPDGFVYLWGSLWTGMFLARTRPQELDDLDSYQYLVRAPTLAQPRVQPEWSSKFRPTAALFDAVPNEMSAAYNPYLRKHLAIHTYHRENRLVARTAPQIWGPWSAPVVIHRPEKKGPLSAFYAAKEHPELARGDGRVLYVTYVDSAVYMPHLLELTLA